MELFWWFLTIVLFAIGLIGTIAPVLPGTTIILAAAIIHRIMLGSMHSAMLAVALAAPAAAHERLVQGAAPPGGARRDAAPRVSNAARSQTPRPP